MHLLIITIYIHLSWLCDLWLKIGYPKIPMFVIISSLNGYFILGIPHFRTNPTIPMFGCISHKLSYRIISHIPSFHFLWEHHHILPIIFPWKPSSHGSRHGMAWQQKGLTSRRSVDAQQLPAGAAQATLLPPALLRRRCSATQRCLKRSRALDMDCLRVLTFEMYSRTTIS